MKIALVNSNRFQDPLPVMPIGLCCVASALNEAGHDTLVIDLNFCADPAEQIQSQIKSFNPDIVGVSIRNLDTSSGISPVFLPKDVLNDVVLPLKKIFNGPIVLGGAAAGINAAELLDYFDLEYGVQGDGENAMVDFVNSYTQNKTLESCAGLVIRRNNVIVIDNPPAFTDSLDTQPWPRAYRHIDITPYKKYASPMLLQTKRGCALKCSYCTYNRIEGTQYRLRSPQRIADEIEDFVKATGYNTIEIVDSTFNAPLDHAKAVLGEIISRKLKLNLSTMGLNPRFIDKELLDLMQKAGFTELCVGAESVSDITLKGLNKNYSVEDVFSAAKLIKQYKMPAMWFLLLGAPGETAATVQETLDNTAKTLRFGDIVNIGIGIRVYNGSPLANTCMQKSSDRFLKPVSYIPDAISLKEIEALAGKACRTHLNFLMYHLGKRPPLGFRVFFSTLFPKTPIWRAYIALRIFHKYSPIGILMRHVRKNM